MNRDQFRAAWAFGCVESLSPDADLRKDYKTIVNGLGATIIRSGLVATVAFIQRYHNEDARNALLAHLAGPNALGFLPCFAGNLNEGMLPKRIRDLELDDYMLATRETLKLALWLKRAVQATLREK